LGTHATVQGQTVVTAQHAIEAAAQEDQVLPHGDAVLAAITVRLNLDRRSIAAFSTTATALDANRQEALDHAVREWSVAYAIPIVAAVHGADPRIEDAAGDEGYPLGSYRVYAGPTGVRGEIPEHWVHNSTLVHATMLARIEPVLRELIVPSTTSSPFHSLKLVLHIRNGAAGEGECRVDNEMNERLCQVVREYPWPQESGDYILKQYYVLGPRQTPAGPTR
jgi:hypothetical protein